MYETLLGKDGFRKGMDLYFARHDGQAVTCDDFLAAMADANDADLTAFKPWYSQAGTPTLDVTTEYDSDAKTFTMTCTQSIAGTPGQSDKSPVLMPIAVGLLAPDGSDMELVLDGDAVKGETTKVLRLSETLADVRVQVRRGEAGAVDLTQLQRPRQAHHRPHPGGPHLPDG